MRLLTFEVQLVQFYNELSSAMKTMVVTATMVDFHRNLISASDDLEYGNNEPSESVATLRLTEKELPNCIAVKPASSSRNVNLPFQLPEIFHFIFDAQKIILSYCSTAGYPKTKKYKKTYNFGVRK